MSNINLGSFIENLMNEKGMSKIWVAAKVDINYKTFVVKLKKDSFTGLEIIKLAKLLEIDLNNMRDNVDNLIESTISFHEYKKINNSEYTMNINSNVVANWTDYAIIFYSFKSAHDTIQRGGNEIRIPTLNKEKLEQIYNDDSEDDLAVDFYIEKEFINDNNGELNLNLTEATLEVRDSFETVLAITKLNENKITKRVNVTFKVV